MTTMNKHLIFDLGFFNGDDTDFYLRKGYNVVAIEGDPGSVKKGMERFKNQIADGKLTLINKAISDKKGMVEFFAAKISLIEAAVLKTSPNMTVLNQKVF